MKVYIERRNQDGDVIERVGPFEKEDSKSAIVAQAGQIHIAHLHNQHRASADRSRQTIFTITTE